MGRHGRRVVRGGALGLVVWAALAASACATKQDLRDLRAEMRAQTARQDTALVRIQNLIQQLDASIQSQTRQSFDSRAELMRQLLNIEEQMIQVQELSGQNQRTLAQLRDQVESRRDRLNEPVGTPGGQPVPDLDQAEDDFDAALQVYNRGSMSAARRGFETFLQRYATHELAPDAHFYLADVLQSIEGEEAALDEFLKIPARFPTSSRVPDALVRAGVIEQGRDNLAAARRYYQRVVNTYPDSGAATQARERLAEIG